MQKYRKTSEVCKFIRHSNIFLKFEHFNGIRINRAVFDILRNIPQVNMDRTGISRHFSSHAKKRQMCLAELYNASSLSRLLIIVLSNEQTISN